MGESVAITASGTSPAAISFSTSPSLSLPISDHLRDIVASLRSQSQQLYHMGFRRLVSRSTLANANEVRDWRIYAEFAQVLIARARVLYRNEDLGMDHRNTVYALSSATIDVCSASFSGRPQDQSAGREAPTLLDLRGIIHSARRIRPAESIDLRGLDHFVLEPGAFCPGRGYLDCARQHRVDSGRPLFSFHGQERTSASGAWSPFSSIKTTGEQRYQTISLKWFYFGERDTPSAAARPIPRSRKW